MCNKVLLPALLLFLMYGCGVQSVEEQIDQHLTKAIKLEEEFQDQQPKITKLETEEQEIYNEIITNDENDEHRVEELSEQAITSIHDRAEEVVIEKKSIDASKEEFSKIKDLLIKIENEEVKSSAEKMYSKMEERYIAYENLYTAYQHTLQLEEELYTMLLEDPKQEKLTAHIQKVNESYEQVLENNEQFNLYTIEYNELKDIFYQVANLEDQ